MKKTAVIGFCCLVACLFWIPDASTQEGKASFFSIGGLVFGDLYHVASFHTEEGEEATGLVVRRGYLTLNADLSEKLFDRLFQPSSKGNNISYLPFDPSAPVTFFIAGVKFRVAPDLFITPNTVVIAYDRNDQGVRPKTDFYLRLTLFLNLELRFRVGALARRYRVFSHGELRPMVCSWRQLRLRNHGS